MPIPNPSLDDLTFEQLVEEAKKNIPLFTRTWTNFNLSDPGITILELFAWLTENQIYTLNKITKKNYATFLKLLGVRPLESNPSKIDLKIFAKQNPRNKNNNNDDNNNDDDNRGSFFLPKRTPFIAKDEEIPVETEEELFVIPSLQVNRCIVYTNNHYSEVKLAQPASIDDSLFSFVSSSLSSTSTTKSADAADNNATDNGLHSSVNSEPFFFLFGDDPKNGDCFYLKIKFSPQHIEKGSEISLSFYLFEKDLPPEGQHAFEKPEDFIDKDFQSQLLWEYAKKQDNNGIEDATRLENIVWSPLNVEDSTHSFSKSGKITFQYPTNRTKETFDLFRDLLSDKERENNDLNVNNKGELWIRCSIIKQNFHFIAPRIEFILTNTVSCSIGYTIKKPLKNKLSPLYTPKSNYAISQDSANPNEFHYQEMSNGLSNQIFEVDMNPKFQVFKFNYLEVSKGEWEKKSRQWKWDKWGKWDKVDDLISSRPYDKHYIILDSQKGLVKFGDGENGKVPLKESKIRAEYKFGNVQHWWIEQGKRFAIDEFQMKEHTSNITPSSLHDRIVAINPVHSSIGRKAETIREAIIRARQELVVPFKAVSKSDFEYLTKNTPGLRVGKVRAVTSEKDGEKNMLVIAALPYSLSPFTKRLDSTRDFRDTIRRHLEKHKLITTRIQVIEPKYVGISINTKIKLAMKSYGQNNNIIKRKIASSLDSYFSLSRPDQTPKEGGGWDFGRNVYRSKIIAVIQSLPEVETVLELRLLGSGDSGFDTDVEGNIIIDELNLVYLKDLFISFI